MKSILNLFDETSQDIDSGHADRMSRRYRYFPYDCVNRIPTLKHPEENTKAFKSWNSIWDNLLNNISYKKTAVVLRDFHVDNIFYLRDRNKLEKIGLIDFQDSLIGHPAYDLVSLLQDVRVFLSIKEQYNFYNYYKKYAAINQNEFKYCL